MTIKSSGQISLSDIATELGISGIISLDDVRVRTLLGKPSGIISLSDAYGKSATSYNEAIVVSPTSAALGVAQTWSISGGKPNTGFTLKNSGGATISTGTLDGTGAFSESRIFVATNGNAGVYNWSVVFAGSSNTKLFSTTSTAIVVTYNETFLASPTSIILGEAQAWGITGGKPNTSFYFTDNLGTTSDTGNLDSNGSAIGTGTYYPTAGIYTITAHFNGSGNTRQVSVTVTAPARVNASVTISTDTPNYVFNPSKVPGYISGKTDVTLTVSANYVVYSTSTASPAMTVTGFAAGDNVNIINNGYIVGMGGAGGAGSIATLHNDPKGGSYYLLSTNPTPGLPGGTALQAMSTTNVIVTNNGVIAGGGGGGGGSGTSSPPPGEPDTSPGGGGGQTGRTDSLGGDNGHGLNGHKGTFSTVGQAVVMSGYGNSGAGGVWGAPGGTGSVWPGDTLYNNQGAGGYAVQGNSMFSWANQGTMYGSVSQ